MVFLTLHQLTQTKVVGANRDRYVFPNVIYFTVEITNSLKLTSSQEHVTADVQKYSKPVSHHSCQSV
jgi:hypothetical protein